MATESYLVLLAFALVVAVPLTAPSEPIVDTRAPEDVYRSELVAFPGPWSFQLGRDHIILVTDQELVDLSDPDKLLNLSLTFDPVNESLRQICERAQARGVRTLVIAFDHFFAQYRPGQDKPRTLMPDMDEYVQRIAAVGKFAESYGLGLELSLLTPLEIGPAYQRQTGESGRWMHYRKGLRDPESGAYSVQLWQQRRWTNNKGPIEIEDDGVRVFAFRESPIRGTPYSVVPPDAIVDISDTAKVEVFDGLTEGVARRIRVHGEGRADVGPLDRILVVQMYRTPEMDYFSGKALPYLNGLIDKYADAGVKLNGLYSDEMHIQQDWAYFNHHDNGEFALRYVSDGLARRFAERYGEEYADFAKYLVYFVHGQEDTATNLRAKTGAMHVFGPTPQAIRATALFRSRYYSLLQDGVVDLFVAAKRHAEQRMGKRLPSRAHATWAESPTIDSWNVGQQHLARFQYEYTPNFVWSCTVHQAASACHDYFKWGEFLTGNGNDHAEGGYLDRDYFALALACSTGIINEIPYSYAAHWGMPGPIAERRQALVNAYGAAASPLFGIVQDCQHRDVDVLMLYPLDLVAAEERFGSWMTQYGYADFITQAKLLELGQVEDGAIDLCGRRFSTIVTTFSPFPRPELIEMMRTLAESGGRVVWSGPPPVIDATGKSATPAWGDLFGVDYAPTQDDGLPLPGAQIAFEGPLAAVPPQFVLSDFLVDRIYPIVPKERTDVAARLNEHIVGASHALPGGGSMTALAFRPRDDQSKSLGYETRTWFEVLAAIGAYPPTGAFPDANDNTEFLSRTTPYLCCRFPNGSVTIAPHFRDLAEDWPGGFARNADEDKAYLDAHPLPPDTIDLQDFRVNGHTVTYTGTHALAFRIDEQKRLTAFAGNGSDRIAVDGHETIFADAPVGQVAWAPIPPERRIEGGAALQGMLYGTGRLRIPAADLPENIEVLMEGPTLGRRGDTVAHTRENDAIVFDISPERSGRWFFVVPK